MSDETMQEWLNRNSNRSFPLLEDADLSCENEAVFPNAILLDFRVCFFGTEKPDVKLVSAVVSGDSADLTFSCAGHEFHASGSGIVSGEAEDMSFRGYLASKNDIGQYAGEYILNTPAPLSPGRVVDLRYGVGVDTLSCGENIATGAIRVADGYNTELEIHQNSLQLRIGDGLGKGTKCIEHSDDYICDGRVLYYLNGQKAGSDGSIFLQGGNGVRVTSGTYKGIPAVIVLTDENVNRFVYK